MSRDTELERELALCKSAWTEAKILAHAWKEAYESAEKTISALRADIARIETPNPPAGAEVER